MANVWNQDGDKVLLDYEMLHSNVAVRYGLSDVIQIDVEYHHRARFGGRLDSVTQGFHSAFGVDQNGRKDVEKDEFNFNIADSGSDPAVSLSNGDRGTFYQGLMVTMQHNLTCGTEYLPAVSYSVTIRAEIDDGNDLDGNIFDVGGSVALSKRFGDWYAYVSAGVGYFGSEKFRGIRLNPEQVNALVALEWRFADDMSLVVQYLVSQGVAQDLDNFDELSHEIALGWKIEIAKDTVLELGLI